VDVSGLNSISKAWDLPIMVAKFTQIQLSETKKYFLVLGETPMFTLHPSKNENFYNLVIRHIHSMLSASFLREEEEKRLKFLAELDAAKTHFFTNISHEFRTPLTLILGTTEELKHSLSEEYHSRIDCLQRNGIRLLKLVNNLLDFSRIESGKANPKFELINLSEYTRELANAFESSCKVVGLDLVIRCNLKESVYVDCDMWEKIVLNLISNSFKFTHKGKIEITLDKTDDNQARFSIIDTGIGIPKEDIPYVFARFYTAKHSEKGRTIEGTGIGLSLVKELVDLHKGKISVESEVDKGTRIDIFLPLGNSHIASKFISYEPHKVQVNPQSLKSFIADIVPTKEVDSPYVARRKVNDEDRSLVLVVDDNQDIRQYIGRSLLSRFDIKYARNGIEALQVLQSPPLPDLILTDIMMPGMNGYQLINEIKKNVQWEQIPIIFISARAGEEAQLEGFSYGIADYLSKPFSVRELLARVTTQLRIAKERKKSIQIEKDLRTASESANDAKDRFLAALSH